MFEKFTEKAIKVIMLAQEEARRLGHNFVGTEQILLGLIGENTGVAAKVLKSLGLNLNDSRIEVEKIIGRGSGFVDVEIPFTPRAKLVLELSLEEALQVDHNYIGTEHLLLGLINVGEGVAARVLENLGINLFCVRPKVLEMLENCGKQRNNEYDLLEKELNEKNQELKNDPTNKFLIYDIGCLKYYLDRYKDAINDFNKAISLGYEESDIYYFKGCSYYYLERFEEAIKDFNSSISKDKENYIYFHFRGKAQYHLKKYSQAIKDFNKAIKIHFEEDTDYFTNRGMAYYKLKNFKKALTDFNKAIKLDSSITSTFVNRGLTHQQLSNYESAENDFQSAVNNDPENTNAYKYLGCIKYSLKKYKDAEKFLNKALEMDPEYILGIRYRSMCQTKQGKIDLAKKGFRVAMKLGDKKSSELLNTI